MMRNTQLLFCDEEHGIGDVTFPELENLTIVDFIQPRTARQIRADAKKAGWTRDRRGRDYCEGCSHEGGAE
jgi:hypothetical protein